MGILNFASVMAVLRGNISDAVWPGQVQFIEMLFSDYRKEMSSNASLDSGLISKWINNFENVSPYIVLYYRNTKGQRKLSNTIAEMILPMMAESAMAVQELNDLLWHASNVAPQTKKSCQKDFHLRMNTMKQFLLHLYSVLRCRNLQKEKSNCKSPKIYRQP